MEISNQQVLDIINRRETSPEPEYFALFETWLSANQDIISWMEKLPKQQLVADYLFLMWSFEYITAKEHENDFFVEEKERLLRKIHGLKMREARLKMREAQEENVALVTMFRKHAPVIKEGIQRKERLPAVREEAKKAKRAQKQTKEKVLEDFVHGFMDKSTRPPTNGQIEMKIKNEDQKHGKVWGIYTEGTAIRKSRNIAALWRAKNDVSEESS
jgi:hypothetical protein